MAGVWTEHLDPATDTPYYFHLATRTSSWVRGVLPAPDSAAPSTAQLARVPYTAKPGASSSNAAPPAVGPAQSSSTSLPTVQPLAARIAAQRGARQPALRKAPVVSDAAKQLDAHTQPGADTATLQDAYLATVQQLQSYDESRVAEFSSKWLTR